MAKQVIWDESVLNEIEAIFEYWEQRTGSGRYNIKLLENFKRAANLIKSNNFIGRATTRKHTYRLVVGEFVLYYKINDDDTRILAVFDSRRNPEDNPMK